MKKKDTGKRPEKGKSYIGFPNEYCVLDLETTGLSPEWDQIIEIGAIKYADGKEVARYQTLVQPISQGDGRFVSDFIVGLTGITNEMLADAPKIRAVLGSVEGFLGDLPIVGYNVNFDINFLYDSFSRTLGRPFTNDHIDALRIAKKLYPEMAHHRLEDVVSRLGVDNTHAHRTISDCEATHACYQRFLEEAIRQFGSKKKFIAAFHKSGYRCRTNSVPNNEMGPAELSEGEVIMFQEKDRDYQRFTKPAELHKAINTLRGIVAGISTDGTTSGDEINELVHWCTLHSHLRDRHPFSEILPVVEKACEDGVITEDESKDILWICSSFADNAGYYDEITSSIQFLAGMIHGVMADGELADREILAIQSWIDANDFLAGTYPFDEINSLLNTVLADKKIDQEERDTLLAFFSNLIEFKNSFNLAEKDFADLRAKYSVDGICAICPEIQIKGKTFCFTGESHRASRNEIADIVTRYGGVCRGSVSKKTDYLIVGNGGNRCWAYACYGRKIEDAVNLRKEGAPVLIVNETDFWDVIDDLEAGIE